MIPPRLKKGDTIGIVAPSKPFYPGCRELLHNAKECVEGLGLEVVFSKNLFASDKLGVSAGTPKQRADDINSMFQDKNINAIWCFQGGGTAIQTLNLLDYGKIRKNPKIFMGKSDSDVLHSAINRMTGLTTFHAPDFKIGAGIDLDFDYSKKFFVERLMNGKTGEIKKASEWKTVRTGKANGRIVGCTIGPILSLAGTKYFPDFEGALFFMESYNPKVKSAVSELAQLEKMGVFGKISGIVIGYIYGFQDAGQFKKTPKLDRRGKKVNYEDLVLEATKDYDFPILKINEFGHYCPNAIIPLGAQAKMDAGKKEVEIVSKCVK